MSCIKGNEFSYIQTFKILDNISLNDVKYYITSRPFQRNFYNLEVIKIVLTKKFKSFTVYKYGWKLVDRNCPEDGMCPLYGELTLSFFLEFLLFFCASNILCRIQVIFANNSYT